MGGHESSGTAQLVWAGLSEALDLLVSVDLVVLQDSELNLLVLMGNLFRGSVGSLLLLLTTSNHGNGNIEGAVLILILMGKEK